MYCDLHTHSHFSDGSLSPSQIILLAKKQNLIVALTDHNTVAGLPEFVEQAKKQSVVAVPGIELSTDHCGVELHLLGLFVRPEHYEELERLTEKYRALKEQSNQDLARRLCDAGYEIDYQQIKASSEGMINRAHFATALTEKGYVSSNKEAFRTLLDPKQGFYCPSLRLDFLEGIAVLSRMGILSVWAHPLKDMSEEEIRDVLPEAKKAGLIGMEVWHSSYEPITQARAVALAQEFDMRPSGGSDFHGSNKVGIDLNCCHVPAEVYDNLVK